MVRVVAQPGEDRRQFRREHVARVHRDHLAELHRRAAQMRELVGDARRIGGGEQQVAHPRPLSRRQPTRTLGDDAATDPRGETPEGAEPRQPAARNGAALVGALVAHAGIRRSARSRSNNAKKASSVG